MLKDKLPWRYRSLANFLNENSNFVFRSVCKTPPIACNPSAEVDYVSLVCHRDVNIFLLACKSFLRFYSNVSVIVHSDGSLTEADVETLHKQLPGVRVVSRPEADERVVNDVQSGLLKSIRARDVSFIKLIDVNLFSHKKKIVVDSDILFLKRPSEVIQWIENDQGRAFHHVNLDANKRFKDHLESFNRELDVSIESLDYCSGFIGYPKPLTIPAMEHVTRVLAGIGEGWGLEQCAYAFLLTPTSVELPRRRYLAVMENPSDEDAAEAVMIHFVGKLKHRQYYKLGQKTIRELKNPGDSQI